MTVVIAAKESTVLPNLDHITIKAYQKDKKQYQDPTVEFFVLAASKAESLEPSFWKK